ncbi:MAG: sugar ABC transporter substrate-binding protein [Anaerolineaceae bacterium]|jgi:ABC-type sugar transport system substrate-binding protein
MRIKRVFIALTTIIITTVLIACSATVTHTQETSLATDVPTTSPTIDVSTEVVPTAKPVKATMILPAAGGPAWDVAKKGFVKACDELGWEYQFMAPVTDYNMPEIVTLTETAVTEGTDVILGMFYYGDMFTDVLARAKENGIYTISIAVPPTPDPHIVDAWIGLDMSALGKLEAELLAETVPADTVITAVVMPSAIGDTSVVCNEMFEQTLLELRPNSFVLGMEANEGSTAKTVDKLNALRIANPGLNAVAAVDMTVALGVNSFVTENNLQGEFWAIGVDPSPENLATLKEGTVQYIVDQGYSSFGYDGVYLAKKMIDSEPFDFENIGKMFAVDADAADDYSINMGWGAIPDL